IPRGAASGAARRVTRRPVRRAAGNRGRAWRAPRAAPPPSGGGTGRLRRPRPTTSPIAWRGNLHALIRFDNAGNPGIFNTSAMAFVHLHTHSEYSLLDGANRIPELLDRVQALGMDSLAVTDHGNLHCAWSLYEEAKARKIRPILGFEAYLAFGSR